MSVSAYRSFGSQDRRDLMRAAMRFACQTSINSSIIDRMHIWIKNFPNWLKSFRRLHFRYDRTRKSFEAFLYLAIIIIVLRRAI